MTTLNQKTISYLANQFGGNLNEEQFNALITEVTTRLNKPSRKIFPDVNTEHFQERVDFYNTVVTNTLRKLQADYLAHLLVVSRWAKPTHYQRTVDKKLVTFPLSKLKETGDKLTREDFLVFSYPEAKVSVYRSNQPMLARLDKKTIIIPVAHLWNDPITVAQHVRKIVAEHKNEDTVHFMKQAAEEVNELNKKLEAATERLNHATKARESFVNKKERQAERKKQGKLKKTEKLNS